MRRAHSKARWMWLLVPLAVAACKDAPQPSGEHPSGQDGGSLTPCLEQATALAVPPSGQLPCELLPPGFSVSQ